MNACKYCNTTTGVGYPERPWSDFAIRWDSSGRMFDIISMANIVVHLYVCDRCFPRDQYFGNLICDCIELYRSLHGHL